MSTPPKAPNLDPLCTSTPRARIAEIVRELNAHRKAIARLIDQLKNMGVPLHDFAAECVHKSADWESEHGVWVCNQCKKVITSVECFSCKGEGRHSLAPARAQSSSSGEPKPA